MAKYTKKIFVSEVTNKLWTLEETSQRVEWWDEGYDDDIRRSGYLVENVRSLGSIIPFGSYRVDLDKGRWDSKTSPCFMTVNVDIDSKLYDITGMELTFFAPSSTSGSFSVSLDGGTSATLSGISSGKNIVNLQTDKAGESIQITPTSLMSDVYWRRLIDPHTYKYTVRSRGTVKNAEIYSTTASASNRPYVIVSYKDKSPKKPSGLVPEGETINPRDKIKFEWVHNALDGNPQKAFELQYTDNKGITKTIKEESIDQFKELPANTLSGTGSVRWQIRTQATNNEWSDWALASFYLGILPQQAPIPISPINQYVMQDEKIRFEWAFRGSSVSENQTKVAIRYSTDNGNVWKITTVKTSQEHYSFPLDTFPPGVIMWHVKTTNDHDEESPYSDIVKFTVIGKPATPKIQSVSKTLKPTLKWESNEQKTYQIVLENDKEIYDSGLLTGATIKEFTLPFFITNGEYRFKVRIGNEYNILSNWAEIKFTVNATESGSIPLIVYNDYDSVVISLSGVPVGSIVYRDGVALDKTKDNNLYIDYTCRNKFEHDYQIVNYGKDNLSYAQSDVKKGHCSFRGATIALHTDYADYIHLQFGVNDIAQTGVVSGIQSTMNYYDGRLYPVMETSGARSTVETCKYYLENIEEITRLIDFINSTKTLYYRSNDGRNYYCNITSLEYKGLNIGGYDISFTATRTDYERVIELD